ncbi:hypothetical protein [Actinomyces capricornis]|nr:hypothetical protein [Actinomyces capricornis]
MTIPGGQVLAQYTWPAPGITYVSPHTPNPPDGPAHYQTQTSPKS